MKSNPVSFGVLVLVLVLGGVAEAQEHTLSGAGTTGTKPTVAFIEASGSYGFQFGEQDYLPTGDGSYKHPLTNGYAIGASAGWEFIPGLALMGNWEYANSTSRQGEVTNALERVEGKIDYHTLALGLRWLRRLGPGHLYGELGGGVLLPFETQVQYSYAPAMSTLPTPVSGQGIMADEYNVGFGAYGQLGYQWDLAKGFYVGTALRIKSFQSDNNGKQTRLENFVSDFTNPRAVNMTIEHDSAGTATATAPHTYSVQDLRLQVALGFRL